MSKRLAVCLVAICGVLFQAAAVENPDEPSKILIGLEETLAELEIAEKERKAGLIKVEQGIMKLEMGLNKSDQAIADQKEQLKSFAVSLQDYETKLKETILPIVETQELQIRKLKTGLIVGGVLGGVAIVGLVIVIILK